jgi:uncharacterized protein with ParB-like and HNH nuclease domain
VSRGKQITATEDTIQSLFSRNYRYIVPEYQRQYSWTEEQWDDFWRDLQYIEDGHTHFLGSVVFVERNTDFDELNEFEIVDGQQRLTTISILLCAMREYYEQKGDNEAADSIDNSYLWEENENFNDEQKIELNSLDESQYRRLLLGNSPREEESNIRRAIEFFASKIAPLSDDEIDDVRKKLLNAVTIVTIDCPSQESAFRLFETLNDRGLELSEVDLMKNHLYQKIANESTINEEAVKQDWEDIIDDIRYEMDKPFRFFIHYFLFAPEPDISGNISQNTLYDTFKELIDKKIPESNVTLEEYMSKMAEDTLLYLNMMNAEVSKFDSSSNDRINEILEGLDRLGYTQERIYLMGVLTHLDSASDVSRAIKLIESYIIRQRFTNYITGSSLNELYASICGDAFVKDDPVLYIQSQLKSQAPRDDELVAAITGNDFSRNPRTLFYLECLESDYFARTGRSQVSSGEIEHIIPRKAFSAKKYNRWQDYLMCSQGEFNEYKDKLGNLTVLEKRLNLEASDKPFEQKKDKYQGSEYQMAQKITEYENWSLEAVEERTRELAEEMAEIWNFEV